MSDPNIYTVGWICAIEIELVAAASFLDEEHDDPEYLPVNDNNSYILGRIGKHNVVIAALPDGQYGLVTAATVARDMVRSFPNVRIGLMVGIGGGAPSTNHDIRLGDVVVSSPGPGSGGVFQYDYGKTIQESEFVVTSHLNQPPQFILATIATLKAQYERRGHDIENVIADVLSNNRRLQRKYRKPDPSTDRLYTPAYVHAGTKEQECAATCDNKHLDKRPERSDEEDSPTIHYGTIASANQLMKDANLRDKLSAENNVLCFEMEAAGLMNQFPCVIIRGICDYSDTHKNKAWQGYAAMAAAAFAKELLRKVAPNKVEAERKLTDLLLNVSNEMSETKSQVVQTRLILEKEEDLKVLKWLTPIDFGPQHSDYLQRQQPGTGQWLLNSDIYRRWVEEPGQTLFCPGIPGAGKTILSSIAIHNLESRFSTDLTTVVVYIYCNFNRQAEQRLEHLMSSLLKQLARNSPSLPPFLYELYEKHARNRTRPPLEEISTALQTITATFARVFIVVDALDECQLANNCRTRFLHQLSSLQTQKNVSVFATSRYMPDIEKEFSDSLTIEIRASEEDIRRYLQGAVSRFPGFISERSDLQDEIAETISQIVDGMFLLAKLYCDTLIDKYNPAVLRKALEDLKSGSKSYTAAYDGAMKRIECQLEGQAQLAKQVLAWITCAQRPLTKTELQHALAVKIGEIKLDKDNITQVYDMVSVCAGLVTIDEASSVVRLVHYTTQKYFESTQGRWFPAAHSALATACTIYLSFEAFADGRSQSDREFEDRLKEHQLFEYAASHWGHHARAAPGCKEVLGFLGKPAQIDASVQAYFTDTGTQWRYPGYSQRAPSGMVATHLAAIFGLSTILSTVCNEGSHDARDSTGRTPLSRAAENGHTKVVQLLLDKGADVNAQGGDDGNALQAASEGGHREIVQLLLDNRADVNARGNDGNALYAASSRGHQGIVQLLVERGADVNAQGGKHGNALYTASEKGYQGIVQILVENGADVNACSGKYGNALQAASAEGYREIVQLLLDKGADVNVQGGYYDNALYAASSRGHQGIVQLLLDKGADVNAQGKFHVNALHAASDGGHREIVQLLLDKGADVNVQGGHYGNALYVASYVGHREIVQLLLEKGADVNAQDSGYSNALQAASAEGYQEIVQLLLDKGADVNAQGGKYGNALYVASDGGHREIVQLLLEKGADVNAQGGRCGNALQAASSRGHREIVQLLLDKGADVNAQGGDDGNALQAASEGGHREIVQLLLDNKADVNAQGGFYGNALQAASAEGYREIVQLLLDNKADVNAQGGEYGNALQAASSGGHQGIFQLLLDHEADVNAQGGAYGNALQAASYRGHRKIVQLLLDNKADVNAQGGEYGNALQAASYGGHREIVQLLLDNKADVNAQGGAYGNALQAASDGGHREIIQLLKAAKKAHHDINLERSMPPLFAVNGDQKKSNVGIERQSNKRKLIEHGQESITKKPCI